MKSLNDIPFILDFVEQCKTSPERVCIIDGNLRTTSYGRMLELMEHTAGFLQTSGITPGSFIGICLPNQAEYIAVEFGIWLYGCAIVPLSPLYPKARIDYIAAHCEAPMVIDEVILTRINQSERLSVCRPKEGIAALFYTSGSTGTPKGVIHTFESLSRISHFNELTTLTADDRFAIGAPLSFIAGIFIFPYLRCGGSVRLLPREAMTDAAKLQDCFDHEPLTGTLLNPSALKQVDLSHNTTLHYVITGSERVSRVQSQSNYRLICLYGMTESTGMISIFDVDRAYDNTPIGKPFSDLKWRLADDGEICLQGPLSPGYYKDEAHTSQLWQDGWFHTGDIGRMLPNGILEYVNRKDWMVKINGQRVETGEISCCMQQVPGVTEAVAKGFTAADGHAYIVGYYVADQTLNEQTLRTYLSEHLASYMLPALYVRMECFPRGVTGKINMPALQSPLEMNTSRTITPPQNPDEAKLCTAFSTALGISPIGTDDDFFALGGDSIRVMQLQTLCKEMHLTTDLIYRLKTPRAIVSYLSSLVTPLSSLVTPLSSPTPLSQTQLGIWAECMSRRGEALYNNPHLYHLSPSLDMSRLARALETALQAHPGLFTSITVDEDGTPLQQIGNRSLSIKVEKITNTDWQVLRQQFVQPFDLLTDRLFRVRLVQTESDQWLLLDFHHIIFDGSSNEILMREISQAYRGETIPEETVTGLDIAALEQADRNTDRLDECRNWYLSRFSDVNETSLPMPDRFEEEVHFQRLEIPSGIPEIVFSQTASRLGVTENVLATAAFGYMLGACNHALSSAFATIYNGRKSQDTAQTVSMLVKTLPILCQWQTDTTIETYLQQVKESLTGAMAHDLYSFAELCSHTAFDSRVLFSYQDEMLSHTTLCGEPTECIDLQNHATSEPFTVQLYKHHGEMAIRVEYQTNMYSEEYIRPWMDCFATILLSFSHLYKSDLTSAIRLTDTSEEKAIVQQGWGKTLSYDATQTVADRFVFHAHHQPDAVAVTDEEGHYTYGELHHLSNVLASEMMRMGVQPDTFVAVMMPRLRYFSLAYMACFKCGAAYVPVDYTYPPDRITYMMEDSQAKVLLTTRSIYAQSFPTTAPDGIEVIFVEEMEDKQVPEVNLSRPDGVAYMIYTSGTTGKPKGVMIEHHSVANLVAWLSDEMELTVGSRIAEHANFSFDASVPDLMSALGCGGELHILSETLRKDPEALVHYLTHHQIEGMTMSTQLGVMLLREYDLPLRFIMLGGEKLSGQFHTHVRLYNGYGPTEFTVCSSFHRVDTQHTPDNIPIGKAVPNTLSAVVDAMGRILPNGIAGELVLVGPQIARGYWQREELTAQRFAPCSFVPGEKMYHTGDLVRWNSNHELLYIGRMDTQVKLRGFRIEPGEIESTMLRFEGIQLAVAAVKEIGGVQHLCGYYTADKPVDHEALRTFLSASLTDYMIPTAWVYMDAMPMTPNGKVDMRALPLPTIQTQATVPPQTDMEQQLWEMVSQQLHTEKVGVTDNLISLGLTSLGAISLSVIMEKRTGLHLPSSVLLSQPTIRQWASALGDSQPQSSLSPFPLQDDYPLTENQLGIYLDWEQHRNSVQYNIPLSLHFPCPAQQVAKAVQTFISAHPYLKTRLTIRDGEVRQVRHDTDNISVPITELSSPPTPAFLQQSVRAFDLIGEPLCRFEIFAFSTECWLVADIHHIIFDGGSENLLVSQLLAACQGEPLPAETVSAYDYALYHHQWMQSEAKEQAQQYFDTLLDGVTSVSLPGAGTGNTAGAYSMSLSIPHEAIRNYCRLQGVTENAFFLTAVMQTLHRFTREKDIAIVTVSGGRSLSGLDHTTGMFVQTLPVVSHDSEQSVGDALHEMHNQMVATLAHEPYPFTCIAERNGMQAHILFAFQGDVMPHHPQMNGHEVEVAALPLQTAKMPLAVSVVPNEEEVTLLLEYDGQVYTDKDIRLFAQAIRAFTTNMAQPDASASMHHVGCVTPEEQSAIIAACSGPAMPVNKDDTILTLLKQVVKNHKNALAVVDKDSSLTYNELDRRSDILASQLIAMGVTTDRFVAVMLPRRKEFVLSIVAIYKAGGAYVPMDEEYPIDRLQYMLEDSEAQVLITTHTIYAQKHIQGNQCTTHVLFIDDCDWTLSPLASRLSPLASHPSPLTSHPSPLAYMIYTSGTTGRPKGVMIEQHSAVHLAKCMVQTYGVKAGTRIAEHAGFSFDASIPDLLPSLIAGGELHILSEDLRKDPEAMFHYLSEHHIEGMNITTQLGAMLLHSYDLPLRYIVLGGEKLSGRFVTRARLINGYGPTEFTVCSSCYEVDTHNTPDNIPIGKALPNTVSAVVDEYGNLLPMGCTGELVLAGPQLARGYWKREELTAQRFVPCRFLAGQKIYHTGDLVRYNDAKELLYIGRIDTQVKLRGFRIELGEIESLIAQYEGVKVAVAQVKEIAGIQHLCAYFTAAEKVDTSALHTYLSQHLTAYMVPDSLMQLDAMPATPNGKIDLQALPLPEISPIKTDDLEMPEGERETLIAEAFAEVLGIEKIGRNSSFFLMGGTSLSAMKVMVRLSEHALKVTYGDIFQYPTPRTLAAFLNGLTAGQASAPQKEIASDSPQTQPLVDKEGYDYTAIHQLLSSNTIPHLPPISALRAREVGDVLLTGATGFLGIHILHLLLTQTEGKIFCLIRPHKGLTCAGRLKTYLMYYFDTTFAEMFDRRIFVLEGDMTDEHVADLLRPIRVDTVINCAANVKHFASGDEIETINLRGAKQLIDYCTATGSLLIQTSTHSISGQSEVGKAHTMQESELYFGQHLETKYQTSKFLAERAILEAMNRGLNAKIMRLGNLMPRNSDGEFQINMENNGFMSRIRAYYKTACITVSHLHSAIEWAPIDETASAILTLAQTPKDFSVFHPFNNHHIYMDDIVAVMNECDLPIEVVDDEVFARRLEQALQDDTLNPLVSPLLAYAGHHQYEMNPPAQDFTMHVLNAMHWRWSVTDRRYLTNAIMKMKELSFFDNLNG